jgi:hypothetical protein
LGVSRQGEFKNTIKIFLQKVHVENVFLNFDQKNRCQFFLDFFFLSRFRVFFSDGSSKTLQKTFCKKNRVEKFLQKVRQKSKPTFSRFFFPHGFGRFSIRGVQKHDKKIPKKNNLTLVLFRTLTHPPTTGVTDFFLAAPLNCRPLEA